MSHISSPSATAAHQQPTAPQAPTEPVGTDRTGARLAPPPAAPAKTPSRLRQFAITLLGVYPVITALLYLVIPLTAGWQVWQTTLIVAPLMVAIMVFWMIPTIQKHFSRFILVPTRPRA